MLATVRKTMQSDKGLLQAGDVVDVSTWRNVKSLISNRYIELVKETPVSKPKAEKKEETQVIEKSIEEKVTEKTKTKK
jgi:hypothetical protein